MLDAKWKIPSVLALTTLLSACATGTPDTIIVSPGLIQYAPEVQERAADELERLGPACPPVEVTEDCSAVKTLVNDYIWTRDKIRNLRKTAAE